jgi:hypothetical protein
MFRFWLALICLLFPAIEAQAANGVARVRIEIVADGIHATYQLSRPTKQFDFAEAQIMRDGNFEVVTPNIRYATNSVTSPRPFRRFVLRVKNSTILYDGRYAPSHAVGEGRVVHAYSLKGKPDAWDTRFAFVLPPGFVRSSQNVAAPNGNIFIGPKSYVKELATFTYIASPDVTGALEGLITSQFEAAISAYRSKLKQDLPSKPVVIAQLSGELQGYQGNVTDGYVTHLRFAPIGWETITPGKIAYFGTFIPHEVFHFWNGGLVDSNGSAMWLTEGSAEYAANLVTHGDSATSRTALNDALSRNLNECNGALRQAGNAAFDKAAFIPASVRYPCGMLMMWAADMRVRRDSGGKRNFFDVWADIVARGLSRPDRIYSVTDFEQLIVSDGGKPIEAIRQLRQEEGPARFGAFVEALKAQGATIEQASTVQARRSAIMQHILTYTCQQVRGKSFGYGVNNDGIVTLETHDSCGGLSGKRTLTHVEGFDINQLTSSDFAGLQSKCGASLALAFRFGDGSRADIPCTRPLRDAATTYSVVSW